MLVPLFIVKLQQIENLPILGNCSILITFVKIFFVVLGVTFFIITCFVKFRPTSCICLWVSSTSYVTLAASPCTHAVSTISVALHSLRSLNAFAAKSANLRCNLCNFSSRRRQRYSWSFGVVTWFIGVVNKSNMLWYWGLSLCVCYFHHHLGRLS